jgi:DNA excision repair protein ERCC-5
VPPDSFPADNIIHAYMNPVVDNSTDRFSWGIPDEEGLMLFCSRYIGWRPEETQRILDPVMKKVTSVGYRQTRLDSFMKYQDGIKFADVRSTRLRSVLGLANDERAPSEQAAERSKERMKKVKGSFTSTQPRSSQPDERDYEKVGDKMHLSED